MQFASDAKSKFDPYLSLSLGQFQIIGRSIAGVESVLTIPQWNLSFDTGRAPDFAFSQDHLAMTHFHLDHAGGLAFYLGLRHLNSLPLLKIIVPQEKVKETSDFLQRLKALSESELKYEVVESREPITLKRNVFLKTVPAFHATPSNAYLIEQKKHHLKEEFRGKSTDEIIGAKNAGIEVEEKIIELLFAFSGDTRAEFFETEAVKAKIFAMECSFFGDESNYEKIRAYGHTHIIDWEKYADRIESECVIMIHTSQRFSKKDIEASCRRSLPKDLLDRLIVFR